MVNNDHPSQNKQHPQSQARHQGKHHDYRVRDARNEGEAYRPSSSVKQQNKTTRIALSILMVLSVILIGFEVTNKNQEKQGGSPAAELTLEAKGNKSLKILAMERELEQPGLITSLNPGIREAAFNEAEALKEANRIQSNKIKILQRQLAESTQKLHDIKSHLFTKGDPAERCRLASICQDLVERERQNEELQEKLAVLEAERERSFEKIRRMEQTVDALSTMTDTQRETKEQAILSYQQVIENLETKNRQVQQEQENSKQALESAKLELKNTMQEIAGLQKEIDRHRELLEMKEKEGHAQASLYKASENSLTTQLQNVIAAVELELLRNNKLLSEMEVLSAEHNAQKEYGRGLERQIEEQQEYAKAQHQAYNEAQIALAEDHVDTHCLLNCYTDSHVQSTNTHNKLKKIAKEEQERANKVEKELEALRQELYAEQQRGLCMEQELQKAVNESGKLAEQLQTQIGILQSKDQEIDMLTLFQASLKEQLQQRIDTLHAQLSEEQEQAKRREQALTDVALHLELEKTQTMQLGHRLRQAEQTIDTHVVRTRNLEDTVEQKSEVLAALQESLRRSREEMRELEAQLSAMTTALEGEKFRTQELHQALIRSLEENENDTAAVEAFKTQLDEQTKSTALLQEHLNEKKQAISDMEKHINTLADQLEAEKQKSADLEQQLYGQTETIGLLQDHVNDKKESISDLEAHINALKKELEEEKQKNANIRKQKELEQEIEELKQEKAHLIKQTQNQTELLLRKQALMQPQ